MKTRPAAKPLQPDARTASKSIPLRLYLTRHGEPERSLSGQHSGRADISPTVYGEERSMSFVDPPTFNHGRLSHE